MIDTAVMQLKLDEGFRATKYTDTTGHESIGYGFNISAGISQNAASALLTAQATDLYNVLKQYAWFQGIDIPRGAVLIELAYNLGLTGLLHFVRMLAAIQAKDWPTAAAQLLDSDAARELPSRYEAMAAILRTGGT